MDEDSLVLWLPPFQIILPFALALQRRTWFIVFFQSSMIAVSEVFSIFDESIDLALGERWFVHALSEFLYDRPIEFNYRDYFLV